MASIINKEEVRRRLMAECEDRGLKKSRVGSSPYRHIEVAAENALAEIVVRQDRVGKTVV